MREILFRGKRNYNEWVYGSLLKYKDGDCFMCCEDYIPGILNKYQVDPETVGQYTGLKDKNGNKIFEGDIVSAPFLSFEKIDELEFMNGVIEYSKGSFNFNHTEREFGKQFLGYISCVEVIGNIFDNPELLEGSEA